MSFWARYLRRIVPGSAMFRHLSLLAGGNAAAQAAALLALPLLTRLYSPADFGAAGVFSALLGLLLCVGSGRYEMAIPLADDDQDALDVLLLCLGVLALSVAACFAAVWLVLSAAWLEPETRLLGDTLWLLPLALASTGAYQALNYFGVRRKAYGRLARTKFSQGVSNVVASLGLGVAVAGPVGLIVGDVLGRCVGISSLLGEVRAACPRPSYSFARLRRAAGRFRRFPLYASIASFLNVGGLLMPNVLFASLYDARVAGLFAMGSRLLIVPASMVTLAVSQVFMAEAAASLKDAPEQVPRLFFRIVWKLALVSLAFPLVGLAAPLVFGPIFGAEWEEAGMYVLLLSIHAALSFVVSPVSTLTILLERQEVQLALDSARFVLVVASIVLCSYLGGTGLTAVFAFVVVMCLVVVVNLIVCIKLVSRLRSFDRGSSVGDARQDVEALWP